MNPQDARAEQLLHTGLDIAVRIRDEHPDAVARAVNHLDHSQLRDLVLLLAACVPVDQPMSALLGWWQAPRPPRKLRSDAKPCGTVAAAKRHRRRGELLDAACQLASRDYERDRKRIGRTAA